MRYGISEIAVSVLLMVLAGCGGEQGQPAGGPSENQQLATSPPSAPSPKVDEVSAAPAGQLAPQAPDVPRQYPSFPDAVTEVPPWNDANPPFDLAKFLETPPAEENAAPLYLDALFEFEDLSLCYVPRSLKWPQYPDEVKRRMELVRQRRKEYSRIDQAWDKDPKSVDMAAADAWLAGYDVGFQKLAAAQQRPRCVFQTGLRIDTLLAHTQAARQVARIVLLRTRRNIERGDFERPIEDLETVLRLGRDLRPRGDMVCQMVSIAVDAICCKQIVPLILNAPAIEIRHCDRLRALLAEHEAQAIDPFLEGGRANYFNCRFYLHDLQHRSGTFDPRQMKEVFGIKGDVNSWVACVKLGCDLGGGGRTGKKKIEALASRLKTTDSTNGQVLLPSAWTGGKVFSDDSYAKHVDALNRLFTSVLDLADKPDLPRKRYEFNAIITSSIHPLWKTTLGAFVPVSAFSAAKAASLREEAYLRSTQCQIALRRWQLEHQELPNDLEAVVKAAGMPGVPIDPYSGQPLRMAVVWGKPAVYSIGPDGKDDKAQLESLGGGMPGDFIFRLASPSPSVRKWTDSTGRHTVEAELVEVKDDNVVLRKANGKTVTLPLGKLSRADHKHLESLGKNIKGGSQ